MAELLKNKYGLDVPARIAQMIAAASPTFDKGAFLEDASRGYEALELMPRAHHMADCLARHLPADFTQAAAILSASLGPALEQTKRNGMAPFVYLPHVFYVARYGLHDVHTAMQLQYELTQRFTAEFSIRPFIEKYPDECFQYFQRWVNDESEHVRRLVSEGTRPRLPWASHLKKFIEDPRPVLPLLEQLKDDPSDYVRRSVANHLNDIGKDNPHILLDVARQWITDATPERYRLVRHALRSRIKMGDQQALEVLGFHTEADVVVESAHVSPESLSVGQAVLVDCMLTYDGADKKRINVDIKLSCPNKTGRVPTKVYKVKALNIVAGDEVRITKSLMLKPMTTRRWHAGLYTLHLLVNGLEMPLGQFELLA